MTPQDIQSIIREARRKAGLTQQQLADLIGVGKPTVNQFETGNRNITVDILCKMLNALHVELQDIPESSWLAYQKILSLAKELQ